MVGSFTTCKNLFPTRCLENQNYSFLNHCLSNGGDYNNHKFIGLFDVLLWLKYCMEIRKVVCLNPFTSVEMSSSKYSISVHKIDYFSKHVPQPSLFIHYHFVAENCILGINLGCGMCPMETTPLYFYDYRHNHLWYNQDHERCVLDKLNEIVEKGHVLSLQFQNHEEGANERGRTVLLLGGCVNLGHQFWNEMTGLHLLEKENVLPKTDDIFMGSYDFFGIHHYLKNKFNKEPQFLGELSTLDEYHGDGFFYAYHILKMTTEFFSFYQDIFLPVIKEIKSDRYITTHHLAPFPIEDRKIVLMVRINKNNNEENERQLIQFIQVLRNQDPSLKFIFEGYFKNYMEDNDLLVGIAENISTASQMEIQYNELIQNVIHKTNLTENDYRSTLGMYIHEAILYHNNVLMGIGNCGSGCTLGGWISKIPSLWYGRDDVTIYNQMDKSICEGFPPCSYIPELTEKDLISFYQKQISM
jgi:hypothetical protein